MVENTSVPKLEIFSEPQQWQTGVICLLASLYGSRSSTVLTHSNSCLMKGFIIAIKIGENKYIHFILHFLLRYFLKWSKTTTLSWSREGIQDTLGDSNDSKFGLSAQEGLRLDRSCYSYPTWTGISLSSNARSWDTTFPHPFALLLHASLSFTES